MTCECGHEAADAAAMNEHLETEHAGWVNEALEEFRTAAVEAVYAERVTE